MIRPVRDALIALALALLGGGALIFGLFRMQTAPPDEPIAATAVAVGGLVGVIGLLFLSNFLWSLRIVGRMRRGEGVIGSWQLTPAVLAGFRAAELARPSDVRSRWRPNRRDLQNGLTIVFSGDGVLVGGAFHGLASTGLQRFSEVRAVPGNPMALEFVIRQISNLPSGTLTTIVAGLRIPIARGAEADAARVIGHFNDVLAGRVLVRPDFWRLRIKFGFWGSVFGLAAAGAGWVIAERTGWQGDGATAIVSMLMMILGIVFTIGGVIVALIASVFHRAQRGAR